ncbi:MULTISPECIES: SEL1-like repeat protein [unclassified Pseudomonas]|uniref:SEL1-like repeat protein n=1 Tax=unclassified Pseudomonas TaxID=196821 RepID=UPI001562A2DA|nr:MULTISPECIES: SEL1-like repeat protein [unclassified Pseudomonas]NRH26621.1 sel1 repeat family protein [Pseudomonas sp. MS19]
MLMKWRAALGYWVSRRLFHLPWAVKQPQLWKWMEGQFARKAALGDVAAQSFYGHILLFRGQGLGAREEGIRLLRLAAEAGDAKSAYQVGVVSLAGSTRTAPDAVQAVHYWKIAAAAGHPLAAKRVADLYREGAEGLPADAAQADQYAEKARQLGL